MIPVLAGAEVPMIEICSHDDIWLNSSRIKVLEWIIIALALKI